MKRIFQLIFLAIIVLMNSQCVNDKNTANLSINWGIISNDIGENTGCRAAFTIRNAGNSVIGNTDWAIYYNQTNRQIKKVDGIANIEQINGDFYRISPKENFELQPGERTTITYDMTDWLIKESDAPHGIYIVELDKAGNERTKVIQDYTITPFTTPAQLNRHKNDFHLPVTPESRFIENEKVDLIEEELISMSILPTPFEFARQEGSVIIDASTKIHYQTGLEKEANHLKDRLEDIFKTDIQLIDNEQHDKKAILLKIVENTPINGKKSESYVLELKQDKIEIQGGDAAGVFYGIQSLIQLFPIDVFHTQAEQIEIPKLTISDAPRFGYRGIHLDVARNFQDKNAVKKLIDAMAFYKLNKLHFHLTEDEGWRLEIKQLPELTTISGFRGHTLNEKNYLQPSYGSGPNADPKTSNGSGFYTQEDFIEILKYANNRHVEVIPEINVPGHARAAIKAMEARYQKLNAEGKKAEAEAFLLSDLDDRSEYKSVQDFTDNVICPCRESVYHFYETVVTEIKGMYETAGVPLHTLHTGGDEVPEGVWEASPICEKFLAENKEYALPSDLSYYFRDRISQILSKYKLAMGGWEEIALRKTDEGNEPNPAFVDKDFIPYVWNNLWGNQDLGYRLANAGYPTVLCNVTHLYFDLAYDKDPKEPGFYWGGFVNTRKALEFLPYDVFQSTKEDAKGKPFNVKEDYKDMERLTAEGAKNLLGIQGQLWGETIKGSDMLEYYYFPKMFGLVQRAWASAPEWATIQEDSLRMEAMDKSWNSFANILGQKELVRLDHLFGGYDYRIPPPGVMIRNGKAEANTSFPGMTIRFERNGKEPTVNSPEYKSPTDIEGVMKFRVFNSKGRGSRVSEVILN
ncbi:MAG: carbohydate-binding domain-containing protein [Bacteroidetes bacterium]|nr:carbohydate-binding domain-containing protein [Bacteroidota bacterium]